MDIGRRVRGREREGVKGKVRVKGRVQVKGRGWEEREKGASQRLSRCKIQCFDVHKMTVYVCVYERESE